MRTLWKTFAEPDRPGGVPRRSAARGYFTQSLHPEWSVDLGRPAGVNNSNPQLGGLAHDIELHLASIINKLDQALQEAIDTTKVYGVERNIWIASSYERKHQIDPNGHLLHALRGPAPFQTLATLWEVLSSRARDLIRTFEKLTRGLGNVKQDLSSPARTTSSFYDYLENTPTGTLLEHRLLTDFAGQQRLTGKYNAEQMELIIRSVHPNFAEFDQLPPEF
jgi:hypothetical protein